MNYYGYSNGIYIYTYPCNSFETPHIPRQELSKRYFILFIYSFILFANIINSDDSIYIQKHFF